MIHYSRPKLSDLYTLSQSKLLENHTLHTLHALESLEKLQTNMWKIYSQRLKKFKHSNGPQNLITKSFAV